MKNVFLSFSGFSIVPHSDWVLQVGVEYDVSVQIYSQDNHKVYMTDVRIFFKPTDIIQAQVSKRDVGPSKSYPGRFSLVRVNNPYRGFSIPLIQNFYKSALKLPPFNLKAIEVRQTY